jgi:hypothetical protein
LICAAYPTIRCFLQEWQGKEFRETWRKAAAEWRAKSGQMGVGRVAKTLGGNRGPLPDFLEVLIPRETLKWSGINRCGGVDSERVGSTPLL